LGADRGGATIRNFRQIGYLTLNVNNAIVAFARKNRAWLFHGKRF
jgi:hypothetical protein